MIATELGGPLPDNIPIGTLRILRDQDTVAWKRELKAEVRVSEILKMRLV